MSRLTKDEFRSLLSVPDLLLAPGRALVRGNITLVLFSTALAFPIWFSFLLCGRILSQLALRMTGESALLSQVIPLLIPSLLWIAAIPFFITAVVLPLRLLWFRDKIKLEALIDEFFPTFQRACISTLYCAATLLGVALLLVGAFHASVWLKATYSIGMPILPLAATVLTLVTLIFFKRLLIMILLPFTATASALSRAESATVTQNLLDGQRAGFVFLIVAAASALYGVGVLFREPIPSYGSISAIQGFSYGIVVWYFMSVLTVFSLAAGESQTAQQVKLLRESATPVRVKRKAVQKAPANVVDTTRKRRIIEAKSGRATTALTPKDLELIFR